MCCKGRRTVCKDSDGVDLIVQVYLLLSKVKHRRRLETADHILIYSVSTKIKSC